MSVSTLKARQALSADALFKRLRRRFDEIPDGRSGKVDFALGDVLMSAFAMFSLKDPSLLAFDKRRQDPNDNFRTIYGIKDVPCDSQMRAILDPVDPAHLRPMFCDVFRCLQRGKVLEDYAYWDGHYLISLDGTGYFSSSKIHCPSCLVKHHRNGNVSYSHQMLAAVLVHPDRQEVIPLAPEPIIKADGDVKNDCERNATSRWLKKIENETFNTLKNQGYHLEHNYGHGVQNLSVVLVLLMMLAFLVDQTQQRCCPLFQAAWSKLGTKCHLWEEIRNCFQSFLFNSMTAILEALVRGIKRQEPILHDDSS